MASSDALSVLIDDHRAVEDLFKRFEDTSDRAVKTRADLCARMVRELSIHAAIEEQLFYPRVRQAGEKAEDEVLEGLEEHHVIKRLLAEIEKMSPENQRYEAKVTVLMENVRHHIEEEEGDMFPRVRRAMSREELAELGAGLLALKRVAPTRPHPNAPDEPPANLANLGVAGMDRAAEVSGKVVRAAKDAVRGSNR